MRTHSGPWKCTHCDKEFRSYYTLKYHISAKHITREITSEENNGETTFICDVDGCGSSFPQKVYFLLPNCFSP